LRRTDKGLAHIPRDKVQAQLREVGFDGSRQTEVVGGLSGGWKMKLELARAMLYNADLLLLDEVCHPIDMWLFPRLISYF
jgi:elongation factor 3